MQLQDSVSELLLVNWIGTILWKHGRAWVTHAISHAPFYVSRYNTWCNRTESHPLLTERRRRGSLWESTIIKRTCRVFPACNDSFYLTKSIGQVTQCVCTLRKKKKERRSPSDHWRHNVVWRTYYITWNMKLSKQKAYGLTVSKRNAVRNSWCRLIGHLTTAVHMTMLTLLFPLL